MLKSGSTRSNKANVASSTSFSFVLLCVSRYGLTVGQTSVIIIAAQITACPFFSPFSWCKESSKSANQTAVTRWRRRHSLQSRLMVEEAQVGVDHGDAVLVTGCDHTGIVIGSTGTGHELNSGSCGAVDVVPEGKEGIRRQGDAGQL